MGIITNDTLFVRSVVWQGCDPLAKDGDQKVLPPWPDVFGATVAAFAKRKAGRGAITFLGGRLAWPWSLAPVRVELVVQAPFEGVVVQAHASGARRAAGGISSGPRRCVSYEPASLRWCWTGERQIAFVVSCTHHRDRRTFP